MLTSRRTGRARRAVICGATAIAAILPVQACASGSSTAVASRSTATSSGTAAAARVPSGPLYASPNPRLYATAAQLKLHGHAAEAAALTQIARTPTAIWASGQPGEMLEVRQVTQAAIKAHATPVVVAYNIPDRDTCGKYSASRGLGISGYQTWINQLAAAIGSGYDIVVVEPDALPDLVRGCLSPAQGAERYQLLHYAMSRLGRLPHAVVYLDAGNPGMIADPAQLAGPLARAGIRYGRGFSANVSNFQLTDTMVGWSQRLEAALGGGAGAVIDTGRNGNGPYTGPDTPQWCNPPGRSLGPAPRIFPGPAGIDAYLWIKDPGVSDGPCNGGPAAGQYWAAYAEGLAKSAVSRSGGTT